MLSYRTATEADSNALADLRIEFMRIVKDGGIPGEDEWRSELAAQFSREMAAGNLVCWICLDGNRIVGTSGLALPKGAATAALVHNMYTVPGYRRRGIGAELLRLTLEEGRSRGVSRFRLQATEESSGLYRRAGFAGDGKGMMMEKAGS